MTCEWWAHGDLNVFAGKFRTWKVVQAYSTASIRQKMGKTEGFYMLQIRLMKISTCNHSSQVVFCNRIMITVIRVGRWMCQHHANACQPSLQQNPSSCLILTQFARAVNAVRYTAKSRSSVYSDAVKCTTPFHSLMNNLIA